MHVKKTEKADVLRERHFQGYVPKNLSEAFINVNSRRNKKTITRYQCGEQILV